MNICIGKWIGLLVADVVKQRRMSFNKRISLITRELVEDGVKSLAELAVETRPQDAA